ncbi:pyridoxal phosphate-dependent transferase [Aspergillus desertorum]
MGSIDNVGVFFAKADKYLMSTGVPYSPLVVTKAKGTRLYNQDGRSILDFTSGQMSSLLGHSHPEIVEVVKQYVAELDHLLFAFEYDGIVPDILALSKTLGCGLPLASVSTTAEIAKGCKDAGFLWLTTHLNDPLTAAVGNKVLEIVERDNIVQRAAERGAQLREGLVKLQQKYWCIGNIRGRGLLQGIEIISDPETRSPGPELGQAVSDQAMARGLSCNIVNLPGMGGVFRLAPPVTVTEEEIEEGLTILDEAFENVLKTWSA